MVWHVADAAFCGLVAVRIAARSPEDAGEEDGNDNGYDDEWGSDIHGQIPQIQIIRGRSDLTGWPSPGFQPEAACRFIMVPPANVPEE